jgi:transcriptional regulator with XRE-family HTH domain
MPRISGQKLRRVRDERLLSQRELAEKAGLSPTTILKLEADRVEDPHPRTVRKLAEALDAEPRELLAD